MTADLHHLAAAYVLDALDDDERVAFENHYPTCTICSNEVREFRGVAHSLAESAEATPPPALRGRVMAGIAQTRQDSPVATLTNPTSQTTAFQEPAAPRRAGRATMVLSMAAALFVLGGLAVIATRSSRGTDVNEVVESLDAVVTVLDPTTEVQPGQLQVVWSDDRGQVAVVGSRLEDPGPDMAYALWFLLDDGVAPAGLFQPTDGSVSAVLDVENLDHNGWGITIEPATGSEQPTSDVLFAGSL